MVAVAAAINREACAVGTTVAHGGEHGRHHATELRFKRLVLQKKTYNSAHFPPGRIARASHQVNGAQPVLSTVGNNNFL